MAMISTGKHLHADPTRNGKRGMIVADLAIALTIPLLQLVIRMYDSYPD